MSVLLSQQSWSCCSVVPGAKVSKWDGKPRRDCTCRPRCPSKAEALKTAPMWLGSYYAGAGPYLGRSVIY